MPTYTIDNPWGLLMLRITDRLTEQIPTLKLIAKDIAQLETKEMPAIDGAGTVLIGFGEFPMNELGGMVQDGEGDMILKIVRGTTSVLSSITPVAQNEDVLQFTQLEQKVYKALHGWTPGEPFGKISRRARGEDNRRPGLMVAVVRYRIAIEDYSAKVAQQTVAAAINVVVDDLP